MKIALCGSLSFTEEIKSVQNALSAKGHEVLLPPSIRAFNLNNSGDADNLKSNKEIWTKIKPVYIKEHFNNIANSDAILVVNAEKHGIKNYIGGATFAEMMLAFHYGKKIFLLNSIPDDERLSYIKDEVEGVSPTVLNGDLNRITVQQFTGNFYLLTHEN